MNTCIHAFSIAAAAAMAGSACADLVDVACTGTGVGRSVSVKVGNVKYNNSFAGQIKLQLSNSVGAPLNGSWTSFCAERTQHIYVNGPVKHYKVLGVSELPVPGPEMGSLRADAIARMYAFADGAQYGSNSDLAAAFQLGIWEISNDYTGVTSSLNLSGGNFKGLNLSAAITGNLNALLAAASNTDGAMAHLAGLGNVTRQDQLIELPAGVPAPGALALVGCAGLFGGRRRRQR